MKRIYDFITKANQVLLFVALLGACIGVAFLIYLERSRRYEPPNVRIAQPNDTPDATAVTDVRFLGSSAGYYVLGIIKRGISAEGGRRGTVWKASAFGSGASDDRGEMVNVVFSKGDRKVRSVLPADGLVLRYELAGATERDLREAHLFRCVTEDTDGNHRLDGRDREDLGIVARNLDKPDMVVANVVDYDVISQSHVIVKTRGGDAVHVVDVDVAAQTKSEVIWK